MSLLLTQPIISTDDHTGGDPPLQLIASPSTNVIDVAIDKVIKPMPKTKISYADRAWNVIHGCQYFSRGCVNCWADGMAYRHKGRNGYDGNDPFRVTLRPDRLDQPLKLRKPCTIFISPMGDIMHPSVPTSFLLEVLERVTQTPHLSYLMLTKRAERLIEIDQHITWPSNLLLGVTVEAAEYQPRIDILRETKAAAKVLSIEPLLGPIPNLNLDSIDGVIVGGEAAPKFRKMDPDWARDIRDQCVSSSTKYYFKQFSGKSPKALGRTLDGRIWDEMPWPS
ncbi:MAG: phage Gp37/Gp68 family protein [Magnetococcales bacterium]|nr:phage Gp37/Gp68 family protein [Magnetococcales bacterium]